MGEGAPTILRLTGDGPSAGAVDQFGDVWTAAALDDVDAVEEGPACVVVESGGDDAAERMAAVRERWPTAPVVVTGAAGPGLDGPEAFVPPGCDEARGVLAERVISAIEGEPEPRRAELAAKGEMLDAVFDQLPVHLYVKDAKGRHLRVSSRFVDDEGEYVGKTDAEVVEGRSGEKSYRDDMRVIEEGEPLLDVEEYFPGPDEWNLTRKVPWRNEDGEVVGLIGISWNVTERKRYERELERRERQFEAVFEDPGMLVGHIDTDGTLLEVNQTAMEFVDADREAVVDEPFAETPWWTDDERESVREWIGRAADGEYVDFEAIHVRPDGDRRIVEGTIRPVTDDGEVVSMVASARDVTERAQRQRELERQNERLDEFAGVVSHDLRNPLNVASGRLELARERHDDDDLDAAADALDRMERLIDNILALARHGSAVVEPRPVELAAAAEAAWGTVETGGGTLTVVDGARAEADPDRVRTLFENLFRNAVEHGCSRLGADDAVEHGSADAREAVSVDVGPLDDGNGFYVADDGPGIPADRREEVFEAGYTTDENGTGLGLNIVRTIAEAHGWAIEVSESASGGARFEFDTRGAATD